MPGFTYTRRLVKQALTEMGEHCSTRRAHRLTEVLYAIWRGDDIPPLTPDPTGEKAVRHVLARMKETTV